MTQDTKTADIAQALAAVRVAARKYRARSGEAKQTARSALHAAVAHAVRAGARQVQVVEASSFSKAQVSRVARGGTSGASPLPPAEYLINTLPADQIVERYKAGENTRALGEAFGCNRGTISEILERCGVPRNARPGPARTTLPETEILKRYSQGESFRKIGSSYGVSGETVRRRLREVQSG